MSKKVRLRFAPSPTGGLHLGGVRTVLYNYLFARQHKGDFVLRIEDTDQSRYVSGAEEYILDCLAWCGLIPDESPFHPGAYGPYRQSERKAKSIYAEYAQQLIDQGHAYYAFDTTEELENMRTQYKSAENPSPQYNHTLRTRMRNSLSLPAAEVKALLDAGTPYVVRIKVMPKEEIHFTDLIRGEVRFSTDGVDDKVLLKADGMPTYHLAVVVDDHLMEITHAFRGEEWLPSAPVHILLWRHLFGEDKMPRWAHLPLILKPDGNGKLSKRDGDRLGFPVFAMNWTDPATGQINKGFREMGFLPEAFLNMLAMLGWNDGSGQELFTLDELIEKFSLDRVHKGGAKFDFEKAKWFNQEWIKRLPVSAYQDQVIGFFRAAGIDPLGNAGTTGTTNASPATALDTVAELSEIAPGITGPASIPTYDETPAPSQQEEKFQQILTLVKDRCHLLTEFVQQASFFFRAPNAADTDLSPVKPKWNDAKQLFFVEWIRQLQLIRTWDAPTLEKEFKEMAAAAEIKPGDLLLPLRLMLVGGKFGPGVFDIITVLGPEESIARIKAVLAQLQS
ncbi:glutamate--tRNA ligase [Flavitalea sp. BT771]|uniref:glutamate--tRNA ligase n=1 Tax=Flavitalea sp. BT771 TaxID=3063329 RepID=UPI0026E26BEE|nr:glutamate--tRNA ligase [Flavitalea sp. BT771]MDO6432614.1 glutamate--tRNA ligase [Flavitalea sp. BT771]MDV6222110.1 glutamate--tRNA ligase [Flavitalea sp. BT771]